MKLAESFIPTAGSVGLLPMITYFFLIVAGLAFLGIFIATRTCGRNQLSDQTTAPQRLALNLLAIAAASSGLIYYLIGTYYLDLLAELPAVSDATDRQTLIRESYNAIGQHRYVAWFITAPILLILFISPLRLPWSSHKRTILGLLVASLLLVFTGYIGHQQLSFDNEIQAGPKLGWGLLSILIYGYIAIMLYNLGKGAGQANRHFRAMAGLFAGAWGIYLLGYLGTLLPIDFNWLHLAYTLTDLISQAGIGLLAYLAWSVPAD